MKKLLLINSVLLTLCLIVGICILNKDDSEILTSNNPVTNNKNNALTMMLETDVDSNEYEVATSNEWPTEGYIFNAEMSACERGGTLSWDSENNRVLMATSSADKCYVYFDRYTAVRITNVTTSNITNNSITLTVEAETGENPIATYYFSNNDGLSYEESTNNTYTFNNLETGTEYNFQVYAVDTNGISSNIYSLSESTLELTLADICSGKSFAECIKTEVYTGDGNEGLYYHDGSGSYTNANQEAGDNSYRYAGANPNNYVCFGSDAATCPNDNLYRIIGVFGENVKLIKHEYGTTTQLGTNGAYYNTYAGLGWNASYYKGTTSTSSIGVYYWNNSTNNNTWGQSNLNTVNLNTNYINYLNNQNAKWNEMIETTTWKVGGGHYNYLMYGTPKTAYNYELGSSSSSTTYSAKIGMMYVSDYYYAASPTYWSYAGFSSSGASYDYRAATGSNWMYMGLGEWTISSRSDVTATAFFVTDEGFVGNGHVIDGFTGIVVRPTFYLKSSVTITSGDGSQTNPFRIA